MERKAGLDRKPSAFARRIRVWNVLAESAEALSVLEIARRMGVSKNTAQRDLDALSGAGIPISEELVGNTNRYTLKRERKSGAERRGAGPAGAGPSGE